VSLWCSQQEISTEMKRHNHQRELRNQLNEAAKERIMKNSASVESSKSVSLMFELDFA